MKSFALDLREEEEECLTKQVKVCFESTEVK